MKRRALLLALLAGPAFADEVQDAVAAVFRARLEPRGEWREDRELGSVWRPDPVPDGWRPFAQGRWRLTYEAGWVWQGELAFSAIAEHRGRWRLIDGEWWWVPGSRFDPAPVAWARSGRDRIAWAPLPTGERPTEGWSQLSQGAMADERPPISPAPAGIHLNRVAPPDPSEVEAAAGRPIEVVSLGDLVDADDLTAWYATDSRSVFGIGNPALRLPARTPIPNTSGPNRPDEAWASFERQRQSNLRENERLREQERRRDNDLLH